ncbi:MAG: DNA repair protein RadC [Gemmatimonadetes bacterium]|nr:DNA repair protein RadC [Gemmatimonadota bacterium]
MPSPSHSIRSWPPQERPRERLTTLGARSLAVRELLAILVGSGSRGGTALDVADGIMAAGRGSLRRLSALAAGTLESVPGVGGATAARIVAALELGRRAAADRPPAEDKIRGPRDVFRRMGPRLRDLDREEFHVLLLTSQHRVIREVLITRGILDASLIHPREVFKPAIIESAAAVILLHNHPSGDPAPSGEDRAVTRQLVDAGRTIGIPVLDHVILGDTGFTSMSELGVLE